MYVSGPGARANAIRPLYLELIAGATRSIFIENPYCYHPDLDVTLVLPALDWNDNAFAHDAQQYYYAQYIACGVAVYEYQGHFTHLKMAVFDGRWSVHGSTDLNFRSLDDDMDFELVVLVDSEALGADVLARVRDADLRCARRFTAADVGDTLEGLRVTTRDPRTLLLLSRRVL